MSGGCDGGSPMRTGGPKRTLKRYDSRGKEVPSTTSPRTKARRVDPFDPRIAWNEGSRAQTGVITIDVGKIDHEVRQSLEAHLGAWGLSQIKMGDARTGDEATVTEYSLNTTRVAGEYILSVHEADVEESAVIIKGMKDEDGRQCR